MHSGRESWFCVCHALTSYCEASFVGYSDLLVVVKVSETLMCKVFWNYMSSIVYSVVATWMFSDFTIVTGTFSIITVCQCRSAEEYVLIRILN